MTRLEIAVRTPVSFCRSMRDDVSPWNQQAETVGIEFNGRLFVWHVFEETLVDPVFGNQELGPTVVTMLRVSDQAASTATEVERFLSALSFYYMQPAEAVTYGTSTGDDPWVPPITRAPRIAVGWMISEGYGKMSVSDNTNLRIALAYYREGQNAGSPFYRYLAYWNCLDAVFKVTRRDATARDEFLDFAVPSLRSRWDDRYPIPAEPARHFRDESRHAIAHALREPGLTEIDPDEGEDRRRLEYESQFLHWIARAVIDRMHPFRITASGRVTSGSLPV